MSTNHKSQSGLVGWLVAEEPPPYGQDVFSDGHEQQQLYDQAISATRAMKIGADQRGHDIFSNNVKETGRRVTGGVHKPPGGGSSIVF